MSSIKYEILSKCPGFKGSAPGPSKNTIEQYKYFHLLSDIVTIVFLALLTYFGFILVGRIVASAQTSPALHLPMYLIYGTVPLSALLSIIQMLLQIFCHKTYLQPRE